MQILIRTT